jgi:hypothetical protein
MEAKKLPVDGYRKEMSVAAFIWEWNALSPDIDSPMLQQCFG